MGRGSLTMASRSSRRVIEVVGPAGCGKTTLLAAIARTTPRVRIDLSIWGQSRWRLATAVAALGPTLLTSVVERRPLRPSELLQMARIEALLALVRRELRRSRELIVLDEGPVFALAWLAVCHRREGEGRRRWHRGIMRRWGELLAGVVHLDASNEVLRRRIRERGKAHPMKGASDAEIDRFTERFRGAFGRLLRDLEGVCGLPVAWRRTDAPARTVDPVHAPRVTSEVSLGA